MDKRNLILLSDSYKVTHWKQYPKGTLNIYSYFESRGGEFDNTVFFGLQYYLKEYLQGVVIKKEHIEEAKAIFKDHFFGDESLFNEKAWYSLLEKHGGKLPVKIKAVPEGTVVPTHNILMSIENTDPEFYWLTNYLETLLVQCWYATTVATQSRECKKIILDYLEKTGTPEMIDYKLHDFGFRGVSSVESATIGGAAHLVNFKGTDTLAALTFVRDYYNGGIVGNSIPASEHSTMTAWGELGELNAFKNMLEQYPTGLVACVSDSWDVYRACKEYWGGNLKEEILKRDGTLVVRPDSGIPREVDLEILEILGKEFDWKANEKGFKVLPDCIRVIQGDGVDIYSIKEILDHLKNHNVSADNIAFGMGGGLLQKLNRDTQKFAFKCSSAQTEDKGVFDVYKDPVTDKGKMSKKGKLKLINDGYGFKTVKQDELGTDVLQVVFENGEIKKEYNFEEIRENAAIESPELV